MLANSKLSSLEPGFLNISRFFIVLAVFYSSSGLRVYKIGMQIKPVLVIHLIYVNVYRYMHVNSNALHRPEEDISSPGAVVTGSCDLSGNQAQVLGESSKCSLTIFPMQNNILK